MKKIVFVLLLSLLLPVKPSQAGLLEFFFPSLKKQESDPGATLVAPFADQPEGPPAPPWIPPAKKVEPLPENSIPLERPHRNAKQISEWLAPVVAQMLTFESDDFQVDMKATEKYFDAAGRQQYLKFLEDNKIKQILDLRKYRVRAYVKEKPLPLNEGAAGGRYHWLVESKVMVSYMDRNMKDYKAGDATNLVFLLRVQLGRSAKAADPSGMVIEHWSGKFLQE